MSAPVLEVTGLSKKFGKIKAVDGLNLTVEKGCVFGILGPNGSGKTTTLGMLLGVINPTAGEFNWFGSGSDHQVRKRIGAILETPCFYPNLSAEQNLRVVAKIKEVDTAVIDPILDRVGLLHRKSDRFQTYSLGMKQRLAIASALMSNPEVIILDEPTNGLDPQGIAEIRELIIGLGNDGHTILLASHLLDEVQRICTDFAVLRLGKKIYQGSVDDLLRDKSKVQLNSADPDQLEQALATNSFVSSFRKEGSTINAVLHENMDITAFHKSLIDQGVTLSMLNQTRNTLEQKFLEILKSENNG